MIVWAMGLWVCAAHADEGSATLIWKSGVARLEVHPPAGTHVSPDAPVQLMIQRATNPEKRILLSGRSALDRDFILDHGRWDVELSIAFCTDTTCSNVRWTGGGDLRGHAGRIPLALAAVVLPAPQTGTAVQLYDFTAVWCPPCNLLAAEVLHDPADAALFAALPVEAVDVDRPESWPLKSRYAVGGYPTMIAVDSAGNEVARLVGYPGEAPTKAWLAGLGEAVPLWQLEGGSVRGAMDGAALARAARRLAEAQKPEAAKAYFDGAVDGEDLRVARLVVEENKADASWLVAHALAPHNHELAPGAWLLAALTVSPDLWTQAAPLVARLGPSDAADCLNQIAETIENTRPDEARLMRAAAISMVLSTLTGDPAHDRGQVSFLADLYAGVAELPQALALLQRYRVHFPNEFTFHYYFARIQLDAGDAGGAVSAARDALRTAFGDQRLRAAMTLARALAQTGDRAGALALLDQEIAAAPAVPANIQVRTTRYLGEAAKLRLDLAK